MKTRLKACPFCGKPATEDFGSVGKTRTYRVGCEYVECSANPSIYQRWPNKITQAQYLLLVAGVRKTWNTRRSPAKV